MALLIWLLIQSSNVRETAASLLLSQGVTLYFSNVFCEKAAVEQKISTKKTLHRIEFLLTFDGEILRWKKYFLFI
jgi:hypothetical protein